MRRPTSPIVVLAAVAFAACGNERQRGPEAPRAASPAGQRTVQLERWGVSFARPSNWRMAEPPAPHIASISSGEVAINLWRYRRHEQLPSSAAALQRARRALVAAARARDRSLRVLRSRTLRLDGVAAVEVLASERIGVAQRQVRSTHLYAHGAELVVDAYAPPREFARMDRDVFVPLLRSLRVRRPAARERR